MFFSTNVVVALIGALIYIFIAFKIPGKYKSFIRFYSIFIQVSFIFFLIIYPLFSRTQTENMNLYIYSYGLDIFYTLIALPFLSFLIYYTSKWFKNVEGFPKLLTYVVFFIVLIFLIALAGNGNAVALLDFLKSRSK